MKIEIAGIVRESIVDGEGIRFVVFVQGCPHHCPGCHNPETHDVGRGRVVDTCYLIGLLDGNPMLSGVTLSGGEPFLQSAACAEIARAAHRMGKNVWAYSGWVLEELQEMPSAAALLSEVDVLVDGPFVLEKKTLDLPFRGSSNQRIIPLRDGKPEVGK